MKGVTRGVDALLFWLERVLAVALIVGITLNFVNVVGRYLGGFTLNGVDEIEIYILVWIAFLGAAIVTWRGEHLRMDMLLMSCPAPLRNVVVWFEILVLLAVASFVALQSFRYVERIHALGGVSDIAHIPTWIPHSAIAICFSAIALIVILRGVQRMTSVEDRKPDQHQSESQS